MQPRKLKMGMIGGGRGAFIGAVHRSAACLDHEIELVAGALSADPQRARESGRAWGLADDRNYGSWRELLERESSRPATERIDFITIVTPNDLHFEIAQACIAAGFHVVCDKPLVHTSAQAQALVAAVRSSNTLFAVTYNYSGYPLVKQAREMVRSGALGRLRRVVVEYSQGWLATALEQQGQKQAAWRTDPARSGPAGALGDIGSHAEQLLTYVSGLEVEALCADLTTFVPGRRLDDDASILLRFRGGARGVLCASQICAGSENDLALRVWGERGGLAWRQEQPNQLVYRPLGEPEQVLRRGNDYLTSSAARAATRLPSGHPEAFLEAFANIYRAFAAAVRAGAGGLEAAGQYDFPGVCSGARGVRFIESAISSAAASEKWTACGPPAAP